MAVTVICPQCGFENKAVGVFCTRCGGRMSVGAPNTKVTREPLRIGRALSFIGRSAVLLGLVGAIALMALPQPLPAIDVDRKRAREFNEWLQKVEETLQQGGGVRNAVRQADINNYLAECIAASTARENQSWSLAMSLQQFQIFLQNGTVRAVAVGGFGPLDISFDVTGSPVVRDGHFALDVSEARIGRLKMPAFARDFVAGKLAGIVGDMRQERYVLDHLKIPGSKLSEGRADLQLAK